ncbi:MAG TPA: hypothetical protein VGG33_20040 [Polyangia bacterium]
MVACALALHAAYVALTLGMPTVIVDAGTPSCPASGEVEAAIGSQIERDEARGWSIRYRAEGTDAIEVTVRDEGGTVRAQRRIAVHGGACAAAAKTVAAIVARAVTPLAWTPPAVETATTTEALPPSKGPADDVGPARLTVALGPAFLTAPGVHANLVVDAGIGLGGAFGLRVGATPIPASLTESVGRQGRARLREVAAFAAPTYAFGAFGLGFEAGPAIALGLDDARTEGITQPREGRRAMLRAGAMAGVAKPIAGAWRVGLLASVLGRVVGPEFAVATSAGEQVTLRTPSFAALVALRIERVFLP